MSVVVEGSASVLSRSVAEMLGSGEAASGSLVTVATDDAPVAGWLVIEADPAGCDERWCAVIESSSGVVLASGPVSEVMVSGSPVPVVDEMPGWAPMLASAAGAVARVGAERDQACTERDQARQQLTAERARLESIVDAAHEYADDHDLCERFDDFMVEHGLRPRRRDYIVELDATVRVSVNVSGRNGADAESEVDHSMIAASIGEMSQRTLYFAIQRHQVLDTTGAD